MPGIGTYWLGVIRSEPKNVEGESIVVKRNNSLILSRMRAIMKLKDILQGFVVCSFRSIG